MKQDNGQDRRPDCSWQTITCCLRTSQSLGPCGTVPSKPSLDSTALSSQETLGPTPQMPPAGFTAHAPPTPTPTPGWAAQGYPWETEAPPQALSQLSLSLSQVLGPILSACPTFQGAPRVIFRGPVLREPPGSNASICYQPPNSQRGPAHGRGRFHVGTAPSLLQGAGVGGVFFP